MWMGRRTPWRLLLVWVLVLGGISLDAGPAESLEAMRTRIAQEREVAYRRCPYAFLSHDYFARFSPDPGTRVGKGEVQVTSHWRIVVPPTASALTVRMAGHLQTFLDTRMRVYVQVRQTGVTGIRTVSMLEAGGGVPAVAESFTLAIAFGQIIVRGRDPAGVRDGIVRLVALMGLRQAPILPVGTTVYTPRLAVRVGAIPAQGTLRDLVFMGHNAVIIGGGSLFTLSSSEAIPELLTRRIPGRLESMRQAAGTVTQYGLKCYALIDLSPKFSREDPVLQAHPELRGALTWRADGDYVLCTQHPRVQQFLQESIIGLFETVTALDGIILIVGGEGFSHCFMRPYGVAKGHTNCPRCEPLGAEATVAELCNMLAGAARSVDPTAEVVVWPYSAGAVWSADAAQEGLIRRLQPGTVLLTEIEKDEVLTKPGGVTKLLWDYSIDLIGPGARAQRQLQLCQEVGIPVYLKSEPELSFEAPRLPSIPCLDRWWDRAEALATCGATGALVFPAFRANYGTLAAELPQWAWWSPAPARETVLKLLASRVAGSQAGMGLRTAWQRVSAAIAHSPELPSYYTGPYYLGPAHPMCADPRAALPSVFYGYFFFMSQITTADGLVVRPTFVTTPTGNVPIFGQAYRQMEALLKQAMDELAWADPLVPARCRAVFDAEASSIRWFYHTARAEANFYESCQLREAVHAYVAQRPPSLEARTQTQQQYARWRAVLADERQNAVAALPLAQDDMRLDWYYGGDHSFPHAVEMLQAKVALLDQELTYYLPALARQGELE